MSSFGERGRTEEPPQLAGLPSDERERLGSVEGVEIAPLIFEVRKRGDEVSASFECASPEACVAYKEAIAYAFDRLNWQRRQGSTDFAPSAFRVGRGFTPYDFARPGRVSVEIAIAGKGSVTEDEAHRVLEDIKRDVKFIQPSYEETQKKQEEERSSILLDTKESLPDSRPQVLVTEPGGIMRDKWRYIFIGAKGRQRQLYLWAMQDIFGPNYNPRPRMGTATKQNSEDATLTEPLVWELDQGPYSRAFALERLEDVHKAVQEMEEETKKEEGDMSPVFKT